VEQLVGNFIEKKTFGLTVNRVQFPVTLFFILQIKTILLLQFLTVEIFLNEQKIRPNFSCPEITVCNYIYYISNVSPSEKSHLRRSVTNLHIKSAADNSKPPRQMRKSRWNSKLTNVLQKKIKGS